MATRESGVLLKLTYVGVKCVSIILFKFLVIGHVENVDMRSIDQLVHRQVGSLFYSNDNSHDGW